MAAQHKVFVTQTIPQPGLDLLQRELGGCDLHSGNQALPKAELIARIQGHAGVICMVTDRIDAEVLAAAGPQLKVVSNVAVGYDNIDVKAARERGVVITNTPGVLTGATANLAFGLLLAVARRFGETERYLRAGRWRDWDILRHLGHDIAGQTLGIVGAGRIGAGVAQRGRGFEMKILYCARAPKPEFEALGGRRADFHALLRESDFVSLHVPLTPETRHLIGAPELALMKASAILINTSRGAVVDEAALVAALQAGRLAGAGLDVFEHEPAVHPGLLELENVFLTPHIGSAETGTRGRMGELAAQNCIAVVQGRPALNPVL